MKFLVSLLVAAAAIASAQPPPTAPKPPWFQLDSQAKRALVEKAVTVKPGDSYQSVTNKLGTPTYDQQLTRKRSSRVVGRSVKYYAVKREEGLMNGRQDELVEVFFDVRDRVQSVQIRVTLE